MGSDFSPEAKVTLISSVDAPAFDITVGAARTCYSKKPVFPEAVRRDDKSVERAKGIFESVWTAGHHTTIQHPQYTFVLENVSRLLIWSLLHSHPFYNSEQVSQRYVDISKENFVVPSIDGSAKDCYVGAVDEMMQAYAALQNFLEPVVSEEYYKIFPDRKGKSGSDDAVHKKVIECARYVVPVAATAFMYHTVSGLTLLRYKKMLGQCDVPVEAGIVVGRMIDAAKAKDPDYFKIEPDTVRFEQTPECACLDEIASTRSDALIKAFRNEFDSRLNGLQSRLVDWPVNAEATLAGSFREVLGACKDAVTDEKAIESILDPGLNTLIGEPLNTTTMSEISRAMHNVHYTFAKKISHTADSQNQRHRMTPGSRPIISAQICLWPDFVWPAIFEKCPKALELANRAAKSAVCAMNRLMDLGVLYEFVQYLLPNATALRFTESGDLLNLLHKWRTRLCYNAQEEIWRTSIQEVRQVAEKHPLIAEFIAAPCHGRKISGKTPFCPEGERYCGVRVWTQALDKYERVI